MNSLLISPIRFAMLTLAMVLAIGLLLPHGGQAEAATHTVAAAKPAR